MESPTITTCSSTGVRKGLSYGPRVRLPLKENAWSRHQRLFKENVGKTKMEKVEGLRILKMRVRELFTHGKGISTPCARHKRWQPLIECANHDFNFIHFPFYLYFPFLYFFYLFWLFMFFFYFFGIFKFFTFLGSTRVFPSLLRIPQLQWGNQTYVVLQELNVG